MTYNVKREEKSSNRNKNTREIKTFRDGESYWLKDYEDESENCNTQKRQTD